MTRQQSSLFCKKSSSCWASSAVLTTDRERSVRHILEANKKGFTFRDLMNVLVASNEFGRDRDDRGRLDLVSGQHPDLDTCVPQQFKCPTDVVLQLVLDTGQPEQLEVALESIRDDSRHRLVAALEAHTRSVVARLEVPVGSLGELSPRNNESAQAFARHVGRLFFEPVIALHDSRHDNVRAFLEEGELARCGITHNDAHALGLRREGEDLEDVVGKRTTRRRAELDPCAVAEYKRQADGRSPLDDSDFIG